MLVFVFRAVHDNMVCSMRTITRDIVGAFFFSKDAKVLLGKNQKGGVYEGSYVVPAGGVEKDETKEQALRREMLEETGIDVRTGEVTELNISSGAHQKTLRDSGERVFVEMTFYDYRVQLAKNAEDIVVTAEDDWAEPHWFTAEELVSQNISTPTKKTLKKIGFLAA